MEHFFGFADAVVAILLNSLWEDALIALVAFGIVRLAPNLSASTRYAIWCASLVAAIAVPLLSTTLPLVIHAPTVAAPLAVQAPATDVAPPATKSTGWSQDDLVPVSTLHQADVSAKPSTPAVATSTHRVSFSLPSVAAWIGFAVWGAIAVVILLRLAFALVQLEKLKRDAMPLPVEYRENMARWLNAVKGSRDVRLCVSDATSVPIAVGLFDAMILIPKHLLDLLAQDEVDQISLHELAHLRRSDDWSNGLQRLIQAILFFNPAVHLIGQQLDLEREVACDDWVLSQTGAVRPYALCLTKMAESTAWPHRAVPAPGVFITRKAISIRVERLLRAGRNIGTSVSLGAASVTAIAIVAIAFIVTTVEPSIAFTTQTGTQSGTQSGTQAQSKASEISAAKTNSAKKTTHANGRAAAPNETKAAPAAPAAVAAPAPAAANKPKPEPTSIEENPVHAVKVALVDSHLAQTIQAEVNAQLADVKITVPPVHPYARIAMREGTTDRNGSCTGCDFTGVNWSARDLHGQSFPGSDFTNASLERANLSNANLLGCTLQNANLRGADLRGANLSGCDLSNADIRDADLSGANLTGAHFDHVRFGSGQARAIISNCEGCDFSHMNLAGADLSNLRISGVDFSHADLHDVNFSGADLKGVDFTGADLRGANVHGAKLIGCDVSKAEVDGVDFSQAQLTGVDFSDQR